MNAPSGRPPASGFATVTMSGSELEFLVGKFAAGAAEAALDFVGDQRGVVVEGELARPLPKGVGTSKMPPSP